MTRYLSKSRFKVALECPRKLAYIGNDTYVDTKKHNAFLKSLAEGGFQVGEMAKLLYPGGIEVEDEKQADQINHTRELLKQDEVTIFEATLQHGDWVARIDVLRKQGNRIELIEVKSKSFDSLAGDIDKQWRTTRNTGKSAETPKIKTEILPYLQDVAFQTLLARRANPHWQVVPFLMVVDKAIQASVDGLNQMFKIHHIVHLDGQRIFSKPQPGVTLESIGKPLLKALDVSMFVDEIINGTIQTPGGEKFFQDAAADWAHAYAKGQHIAPMIGAQCRSCEFYCAQPDEANRSGFHECWEKVTGLNSTQINAKRPITRLYHPVKGEISGYFKKGIRWMEDINESEFEVNSAEQGMSRTIRQHLQLFGNWTQDKPFEFDAPLWLMISKDFVYPLHFIDFEGSRPALPFLAGKRPYGQIAFQFSHHVMHEDGSVVHANEYIDLTPGYDPSVDFVCELQKALCAPGLEKGTVLMWSNYENTMLNGLRDDLLDLRLADQAPNDVDDLIAFLESLTVRKVGKDQEIKGKRAMVDLYKIALQCFFHPDTEGRASIKVVLPAVLKSSVFLKQKYSQPIYGSSDGIPSKNFPFDDSHGMVWWQLTEKGLQDPYHLLPPLFTDLSQDELQELEQDEDGSIREGGAATTAYARMQFEDVSAGKREATRKALLRYCELDTLAMVMIFEAWQDWASGN